MNLLKNLSATSSRSSTRLKRESVPNQVGSIEGRNPYLQSAVTTFARMAKRKAEMALSTNLYPLKNGSETPAMYD